MAKHRTDYDDNPRIEDFVRPRINKQRRTGRRSITLWIDGEIINQCGPQPATKLRKFIESHALTLFESLKDD